LTVKSTTTDRTVTTDNDYGPPQQRLTDIAYRLSLIAYCLSLCHYAFVTYRPIYTLYSIAITQSPRAHVDS